jgi:hypothetical protein
MRHTRGSVNWHEFMNITHTVIGVLLALWCGSDLPTRHIPNVLTRELALEGVHGPCFTNPALRTLVTS